MTAYDTPTVHGVHLLHDGPETAPPLLLIHGSGATGSTWEPMVPALAERFHVLRIDLPGCGRSSTAPTYAVPDQADRVAAVLDDLGITKDVAVAGHSSGGYVATALAERRPELVGPLALISTGPSMAALLPEPALVKLFTGGALGALVWRLRTDALLRKGIAATAARPVTIGDEVIDDLRRTSFKTFRAIMQANRDYLVEQSIPQRLLRLGRQPLVVFGDADPRWDPESAHEYDVLPDGRVEYLAGVGHIAMLEAPDETARLLLDFLG
ncbi:alpha/beta fold hydrolase [Nocardioides sp. YIM B13467]|uniref:alpha/beta fold hydrolase n=1 Tax=Nocardioides sp. YIM B13467 TaxID=3366294 RepID=UPI003671F244